MWRVITGGTEVIFAALAENIYAYNREDEIIDCNI